MESMGVNQVNMQLTLLSMLFILLPQCGRCEKTFWSIHLHKLIGADNKQDGLLLNWRHAVNNRSMLDTAIMDACKNTWDKVHMIEVDVDYITEGMMDIAILRHDINKTWDMKIDDFIDRLMENECPIGVKLDFKRIRAAELTIPQLRDRGLADKTEIWLNADVAPLSNAYQNSIPVPPVAFLNLTKTYLNNNQLSLGWYIDPEGRVVKTLAAFLNSKNRSSEMKTREQQEMLGTLTSAMNGFFGSMKTVLRDVDPTTPVTFPIMAGLLKAPGLKEKLVHLVKRNPERYSITLYDNRNIDKMNDVYIANIRQLRRALPKYSIFYDLPQEIIDALRMDSPTKATIKTATVLDPSDTTPSVATTTEAYTHSSTNHSTAQTITEQSSVPIVLSSEETPSTSTTQASARSSASSVAESITEPSNIQTTSPSLTTADTTAETASAKGAIASTTMITDSNNGEGVAKTSPVSNQNNCLCFTIAFVVFVLKCAFM